MLRDEQIAVARRLLDHIAQQTLDRAAEVYRQPVAQYFEPAFAARERERFFRREPLCVGLSALLPAPGAYQAHDLSGLPLLLVRDRESRFRAFLNVCRHRGARVAEGEGSTMRFTCPYHAWVFDLDGALVARPDEGSFAACPREAHALTELPAAERDGLLWVAPAPDASFDLDAKLGELAPELAALGLGGFHHYKTVDFRRRMNWKLVVDTFLESYHFCVLHRDSICSIFHHNLATFDTYGANFRLISPRKSIAGLNALPEHDWQVLPHLVGIYVLFPNTVLVWQGEQVEFWQIYPGADPDHSVARLSLYSPVPALTEKARRHWDRNLELVSHVVENEDFPVGEGIQRGFHSGAQTEIVFGVNEPALGHYHAGISAAVG